MKELSNIKKIKYIIYVLAVIVITIGAVFVYGDSRSVHANDYDITYRCFRFKEYQVDITGTVGQPLANQVFTIQLEGGNQLQKELTSGTDISSWFFVANSSFPYGVKTLVKETAGVGASEIKIEFTGTPLGASKDSLKMKIKSSYLGGLDEWANVEFSVAPPKFNIVRPKNIPSGFSAVGGNMYFKTAGSSNGWKLTGEKGAALSGSTELEVFVYGSFVRNVENLNISSWFTGALTGVNMTTYQVTNSNLPKGVTARLKSGIRIGDSSFTIVFSGTPTQASKDLIAFTIPEGYVLSPTTDDSLGDRDYSLSVTNTTGRFSYNITSEDEENYKTEYIKISVPDRTIHIGDTITESDNFTVTYEIVGTLTNGTQIKYTEGDRGIRIGDNIYSVCLYNAKEEHMDGGFYDYLGLKGKVTGFNSERTIMTVRYTGTVDFNPYGRTLPYTFLGGNFALGASYTTAGRIMNGVLSDETKLKIDYPASNISIISEEDLFIKKKATDDTAIKSEKYWFKIDLGDDTFAKDITPNSRLPFLYPMTKSDTYCNIWNGVYIQSDLVGAKAGDNEIFVYLMGSPKQMIGEYKGYLQLAIPKEYLTRQSTNANAGKYIYFGSDKIYVEIEKPAVDITVSNLTVSGEMYTRPDWSTGSYGKKTMVYPIGDEKLHITVNLDSKLYIDCNYPAGSSVLDFIKLDFDDSEVDPFSCTTSESYNYTEGYRPGYSLCTENAISKGFGGTLNLVMDLSKCRAKSTSSELIGLKILSTTSNSSDAAKIWFKTDKTILLDITEKTFGAGGSDGSDSSDVISEGDIVIYATDANGNKVKKTYINLTTEKLVSSINYKCYSTDGGSKWKAVSSKLTDKQFSSLLNKGLTLMIADKFDKKSKQPAEGAIVYSFTSINKRPAAPKLKAEYKTYADPTGFTPGKWTLADKSNTALSKDDLAKYEIGIAGTDKKTVSDAGYSDAPTDTGIDFEMASGKTADSTVYLVRTKATEDTPASNPGKITVKGQGKASKIKTDYKKEILKVKKGMIVYFGEKLSEDATELKTEPKSYSDYTGKYIIVDEAIAKSGIDISGYITDTRNTVMIWTAATEKKASTVAQVIKLAKRDNIKAEKLSVTGGKFKLDKKYEVYDEAKGKWGGLPKITENCELKIRLKATAKGGAESDSSYAASTAGTLKITYDVIDAEKNKSGIVSAEIVT